MLRELAPDYLVVDDARAFGTTKKPLSGGLVELHGGDQSADLL